MSEPARSGVEPQWSYYWRRHTNGDGQWNTRSGRREPEGPPGADLAALRRGLGREPGSVPAMWRFYVHTNPAGDCTRKFRAEHAALTLFAVHQQSQARPMHRGGIGLGRAVRALREYGDEPGAGQSAASGRRGADASPAGRTDTDWSKIDAVDRRLAAAATASDLTELVAHLRGLVTRLRGVGQPLDYDVLVEDLYSWQFPDGVARVRRRWGMQYFTKIRDVVESNVVESDLSPTIDSEEPK